MTDENGDRYGRGTRPSGPYPFGRRNPLAPDPTTRTPADADNGPDPGPQPVALTGVPAHHVALSFLSGRERCACGYEGTRDQVSIHLQERAIQARG